MLTITKLYRPISQLDHDLCRELATYTATARHTPEHETVALSYDIFKRDLFDQYMALLALGVRFEFTESDPYETFTDLKKAYDNGETIRIFNGGEPLPSSHPFAAIEPTTGQTYNVIFRAVHDILGHCWYGNEFTPLGEENAVRSHYSFCSGGSLNALICETRCQNSFVAFGPHRDNETVDNEVPFNRDGSLQFPDQNSFYVPKRFCKF